MCCFVKFNVLMTVTSAIWYLFCSSEKLHVKSHLSRKTQSHLSHILSHNLLEQQNIWTKSNFFRSFYFYHSNSKITIQIWIDKSIKTLHDILDSMSDLSWDFLKVLSVIAIFSLCFIAVEIEKLFTHIGSFR